MKEFFEKIWNSIVTWFIDARGWASILGVIAVIVLGYIAIAIIMKVFKAIVNKTKLKGLAGDFIGTIIRIALIFVYIMAILGTLGVDTSGIVAILTSATLAFSLALQSTLANFSSGLVLVSNHPFKEGDFIEAAGISGVVVKITLNSTKIKTGDNKVITVPNAAIESSNIINYSTESKRRVDLTFSAAYGSDLEKVKAVITDELNKHPLILHEDGYTVRLSEQGASSLNFVCRCWVNSGDYWTVVFDLNENMYNRFNAEGIEIPYNKIDVNVITNSENN